jgi:hypothetical protein
MIRTPHSTLESMKYATQAVVISAIALVGIGTTPANAGSPASIPGADETARTALSDFAKTWMGKMEKNEARNRRQPTVRPGAEHSVVTYRGFGEDYKVELRPTGHPVAPFIGILRYTEQVYTCQEAGGGNCSVASTVPVTEIFRFQSGRWVY